MADILLFIDDPDLFNELPAADRQAYERRVDAVLAMIEI
jgi:hypothetical protein